MTNEGFRFQIEDAFTVWHGRFITMTGQLLDGTISTMDRISVPLIDGTRGINHVTRLGENWKLVNHISTEPGQPKVIDVQVWGNFFPQSTILLSGIATKAEPLTEEETNGHL